MPKLAPLIIFDVQTVAPGHRRITWNGKLWIAQTEHFYSGGILSSKKWLLFAEDMSGYINLFGSIDKILAFLMRQIEGKDPRYIQARIALLKIYGSWGDAWLAEPDIVEYLERALS